MANRRHGRVALCHSVTTQNLAQWYPRAMVNALANGDSKAQIAKGLLVSRNTASAVAEQECNKVEQRKGRIAAQAEHAATRAFERINNKLDSPDDIPLNILVPVTGFSIDKTLALRGEPTMVARIDHVYSGNIFQAYVEVCEAVKARASRKPISRPRLNRLCQTVSRL
jgi:hypothetical protein